MEFDLIEYLRKHNPVQRPDVLQGIGDDCARLRVESGYELAVTTDTLVSGVHFPADTPPHAIGYKSLAVNLSDLAAMGAEPAWVTLAMTLPRADMAWLASFAEGFFGLAERYGVQLVGGDTTQGPLSITVQAQGFIPQGQAITRAGARPGDYICVTGFLGEAGLNLLKYKGGDLAITTARNRLNYPEPRIIAGIALRGIASAAIDVSDGLIADLGHILTQSGVGARLTLEDLPLSAAMLEDQDPAKMYELALTAGDDYELCFTIGEQHIERINQLQYDLKLPIKHIGNIQENPGLRIYRRGGEPLEIASGGYEHFSDKRHG
ncbi:MAG TPA: thiamine-phosphate kinase [Gammaproteobacteria bacterium]|nr:thiamine-phosphate kinase [Gammaproteobacteria bacterium]